MKSLFTLLLLGAAAFGYCQQVEIPAKEFDILVAKTKNYHVENIQGYPKEHVV